MRYTTAILASDRARYRERRITSQSTVKMKAPRTQCVQVGACRYSRTQGYRATQAAQNAAEPATFDETPNLATAQLAIRAPVAATTLGMMRSARCLAGLGDRSGGARYPHFDGETIRRTRPRREQRSSAGRSR